MSDRPLPSYTVRRLPPQPSLEQLKKQAKELLEQYRGGDPAALADVRHFEHAADRSTFALHDAQRVLARTYGFQSWPRLKAFVDGVNIATFAEAVQAGNSARVRSLLHVRPELVSMDRSGGDEHRALHYAVLRRDVAMVQLLMEAGADARKGIYPHRDATSALTLAKDREYSEIVAVIEEEERLRRQELSCPNATVSPVQEQINHAIAEGDNTTALQLLEADRSLIQACDRIGATPLHVAAQAANLEILAWLLERRANVRKQDVHGFTALDRAAVAADPRNNLAQKFPAVARLLLQHGAELTMRSAVALADGSRVRELARAEPALLRQVGQNGGLLTLAVNHGKTEIVRLLLDMGADVDERIMLEELEEPTLSWGMPLYYAALAANYEISRLLLDRGADPNSNVYASGWPLRNAWGHKDDSVKRLLLERGAKPQPYMVSEAHDVEEARRLLAVDASEDLAQELAWSAADHGCPAILELALPRLQWAPDDPRWDWILIQPIRGAPGRHTDEVQHFQCMQAILRHGVNPNVPRFGRTLLHYACAGHGPLNGAQRARFAALLLDHGARLDVRDDMLRSTPLGWACRWGHREVAELLLRRGASHEEPDAEPWATPTAWAKKKNHEAIVDLLDRWPSG